MDMNRDIGNRLENMNIWFANVRRIALNMDQVIHYDPPPNPTKLTDSRAGGYIADHGYESWELDALEPHVIDNMVREAVIDLMDLDEYESQVELENDERATIKAAADGDEMKYKQPAMRSYRGHSDERIILSKCDPCGEVLMRTTWKQQRSGAMRELALVSVEHHLLFNDECYSAIKGEEYVTIQI